MSALPTGFRRVSMSSLGMGLVLGMMLSGMSLFGCALPRKDNPDTCTKDEECASSHRCNISNFTCLPPDDAGLGGETSSGTFGGGGSGATGAAGGDDGRDGGTQDAIASGGTGPNGEGGLPGEPGGIDAGKGGGSGNADGGGGLGGAGDGAVIAHCLSMADCASTPGLPLCDPGAHACVACSAALCTQLFPGQKPVCGAGSLSNQCEECNATSQCTTKSLTPVCVDGSCVACAQSGDCKSAIAPICNLMTHVCTRCGTGVDCTARGSGTGPICLPSGACVQCASNGANGVSTDCSAVAGKPVCSSSNLCVQCVTSGNCATPALPICNTGTNLCARCALDSECVAKDDGKAPWCAVSSGTCIQCRNAADCKSPTPGCSSANVCVQCTQDSHCAGATPICDLPTNKCVACSGGAACMKKNGAQPICLTPPTAAAGACVQCGGDGDCGGATPGCSAANVCVQCTTDAHCGGATPICDTSANRCVPCATDAQCKAKTPSLGANPGVCMSHVDGHCAVDAETLYVENRTGCADAGMATSSAPLCSMRGVPANLDNDRNLIVVRGPVVGANGPIALAGGRMVSIVGQNAAAVTGTTAPALWLSGDTYVRDLALSATTTGCLATSGATFRTNHVTVADCGGGGILLDGAGFDIRDTIVTRNGPGIFGLANWGGILINNPPAMGTARLDHVTVQTNNQVGISCSTAVAGTGVSASGNAGGVQISPVCGFMSCGAPGTTCGAVP